MVTHEELENDVDYEEIREDVGFECNEQDQVLNVVIPRAKDGYPIQYEGCIYVAFTKELYATYAAYAGRLFADRRIVVQYVSIFSLSLFDIFYFG